MPPVMGAAAFVMAEYTGIPYGQIILAALIPGILYYLAVFTMVHFEAKKLGLKPASEVDRALTIKNLMKDVRGKINDQLDVLYSLSLSWSEKKGRVSDYQDVRLLQRKGVKRGMISIQFSDDIARYLLCSYVMQYPEALLSIDERSPRAYRVGYKLAYHSSVRRNIERGTADIISVSALLDACGDIPDFDEVQKTDRGHWENRIKTPLETALDSCVRAGVLDGWEYCGAKKAKLSDSEVDIGDYATFIGLYVRFRMGRMNDED